MTATVARVASAKEVVRKDRAAFAEREREIGVLDKQIQVLSQEGVEWGFFSKAFGRDGLPVLEIDAAGPTVSTLCNQLLEACFGSRFSVEFVTQEAKLTKSKDGSEFKDAFTVQITDNERGRRCAGTSPTYQAANRSSLTRALKNAIAIYSNTRSEMPIQTCWRDETTGPLDPENADRYIQMLRKVRELGGFHHVLYVSHNESASGQADAQIQLEDGRATVALPPFT